MITIDFTNPAHVFVMGILFIVLCIVSFAAGISSFRNSEGSYWLVSLWFLLQAIIFIICLYCVIDMIRTLI